VIRPSKEVLERLLYLKNDSVLVGWLTASLEQFRDEAVLQADDTRLRQVQGSAQVLREVLDLISRSDALLHK